MATDHEAVPSLAPKGFNFFRRTPKQAIYLILAVGVLFFVGILKALFPLILMSLLLGFIWKQAIK